MPHSILLKHVQNQNNSQQLVNFINTFGLFFLKSLQKNITICEFQDMNMYIHKLIASYDVHKTLTNQYTERNPFMGCCLLEEHYYGMKLRCQFKLEGKFSCKMNNAVSPCSSSDSFGVKIHKLGKFVLEVSLQSGFSSAGDCGSEGQKCNPWSVP